MNEMDKIGKVLEKYKKKSNELSDFLNGNIKEFIKLKPKDFNELKLPIKEKIVFEYLRSIVDELFNPNNMLVTIQRELDLINLEFILLNRELYIDYNDFKKFYDMIIKAYEIRQYKDIDEYFIKNETMLKIGYKDDAIVISFSSKINHEINFDLAFKYNINLHGDNRILYYMFLNTLLTSYKHYKEYVKQKEEGVYIIGKIKGGDGYV